MWPHENWSWNKAKQSHKDGGKLSRIALDSNSNKLSFQKLNTLNHLTTMSLKFDTYGDASLPRLDDVPRRDESGGLPSSWSSSRVGLMFRMASKRGNDPEVLFLLRNFSRPGMKQRHCWYFFLPGTRNLYFARNSFFRN